MRVRYLVSEAGLLTDRQPDEIYDLPEAEALAAIRGGKAEPVKESAEAAMRAPSENASLAKPKGRRA